MPICLPLLIAATRRVDRILRKVDHGDARAGRVEGKRDLAADAAGGAGEQHRLSLRGRR